jgi:hypothetical protein
MFENKVVRGILEFKKGKRTGDSRRLHIQELHNLYLSLRGRE